MTKFRMPYEGNKHSGTIILLPFRKDTWTNGGLDAMNEFLEIVSIISKYEPVYVIYNNMVKNEIVQKFKMQNVFLVNMPYNDAWARDNTFINVIDSNGHVKALDFGFNAWGGKVDGLYEDFKEDNQLASRLANYFNMEIVSMKDFILEGGSINTNGNGLLLTTKACLLSKGRNPNLNQIEIENVLKNALGQDEVIWLNHGIYNDETNEHVDNLCQFKDEKTVFLAYSTEGIQGAWSKENYEILKSHHLDIIKMPIPSPQILLDDVDSLVIEKGSKPRMKGDILAASYVNFYQGADFVILPQFGVNEDSIALEILRKAYPNKKIYPVYSLNILKAGGNIHCITKEFYKESK